MRFAILLAWGLAAGAAERDSDEVMKRATERVLASAARIPSYTCVETVTREYYRPTSARLPRACSVLLEQRQHPTPDMVLRRVMTDRLRLDVTLTGSREIFSWVGASRFDDSGIDHVVTGGPIGTGAFGGFLSLIFKQDVKNFGFERSLAVDGRNLMEYSYQVSKEDSSYKVKVPDSWIHTAYRGTVRVDPETGDVVGFTVKTDELPSVTSSCEITLNVDLKLARIGDGEFLLPVQARHRYVMANGDETENTTTFAGCREYRGESTVTFAPPEPGAAASQTSAAAAPVQIPAQSFTFELTTPIEAATAAAGDAISGKLATPLRDGRHRTLARAGSRVEGRLLRVERHYLPAESTVLVFRLESVEIAATKVPLAAVRDWSRELAARRRGQRGIEILMPLVSEKNAAVFRFAAHQEVVKPGFRSEWRTM